MPTAKGIGNYTPCSEPGCRKKAIAQGKCRIHVGKMASKSATKLEQPANVERVATADIAVAETPREACRNRKPDKAALGSPRFGLKSLCFQVGLVAGKIKSLAEKQP